MNLVATSTIGSPTVQSAEDPSTTHFEKYVVMHIQKLLDGQERLERLLFARPNKDKQDESFEDEAVTEQKRESQTSCPHVRLTSSLPWAVDDVADDDMSDPSSCTRSLRKWPVTLPASWPKSLSLKDGLQGFDENEEEVNLFREQFESMIERNANRHLSFVTDVGTSDHSARRCALVLIPTHPVRLVLDTICMLCLAADLIMIPWILAWDVEAKGILKLIQFAIMIYWSIDILFSFLSAYVSNGIIVTDLKSIALHYLRHGFALDLLIVAIDWFSFAEASRSDESANVAKGMRVGKLGRLFRIVAVFRMSRVSQAYFRVVDYCTIRGLTIILNSFEVVNLLVIIVYINHVLGCCWFALSTYAHSDTGARWIDTHIVGRSEAYRDSTPLFQYTSAFHWALTQMTPGSMQLNAQNSPERVFNIICLVFGVLFFGTLISTLATKMMDVKRDKQRTRQLKKIMMSFLKERQVNETLALLVKKHLEARMKIKKGLILHDIDAFSLLSGKLLSEVHLAICRPFLSGHPLFVVVRRLNARVSTEVCFQAMKFHALSQQDTLFNAGDTCSETFIISEGTLAYTQEPGSAFVDRIKILSFQAGTWFCEAALWCEWIHLGTADCAEVAEVLKISSIELLKAIRKHIVLSSLMKNYGTAYHKQLTFRRAETLTDLNDDAVHSAQILCHLGENLKMILNLLSLKIFHEAYGWYGSPEWRRLKTEIVSHRTTLVPISDKSILRCIEVSCLKLARADGCIFARVGTWSADEQQIQPHIILPGSKLKNWEDPEVALERMCKEDLGSLGDLFLLLHLTVEHTLNTSRSYMVDTDYSRHVFEARLNAEYKLASWLTQSQPVELAHEVDLRAVFYHCQDSHNRTQVYAWMSPHDFDSIRSGRVDIHHLLKDFDYERAFDLKTPAIVEDFDISEDSSELHSKSVNFGI